MKRSLQLDHHPCHLEQRPKVANAGLVEQTSSEFVCIVVVGGRGEGLKEKRWAGGHSSFSRFSSPLLPERAAAALALARHPACFCRLLSKITLGWLVAAKNRDEREARNDASSL